MISNEVRNNNSTFQREYPPWWDERCAFLLKEKRRLLRLSKKQGSLNYWLEHKRYAAALRKYIREIKCQYSDIFCDLEDAIGDSDEEYDRRRARDKFRRERSDYQDRGREERDQRDDWSERDGRGSRREYRDYDYRNWRERYSPAPRHDISPPMKRMRRDWEDRGGYGNNFEVNFPGGGIMGGGMHTGGWGMHGGGQMNPQRMNSYDMDGGMGGSGGYDMNGGGGYGMGGGGGMMGGFGNLMSGFGNLMSGFGGMIGGGGYD